MKKGGVSKQRNEKEWLIKQECKKIFYYHRQFSNAQYYQGSRHFQKMLEILYSVMDQEQIKLIGLMFLAIPLSFLFSKISSKQLLIPLTILLSALFQHLMFPFQKYFLWAQQQIVFLLLLICPRKHIGTIIIVESFIFLFFIQVRRMYIAYAVNGIDITGIFMMQVFLYAGIGYNYQNGAKPEEQLSKSALQRRIIQRPDYMTYMGYVFFLPACLVGPVFQYRDFEDYVNRKGDYAQLPPTWRAAGRQFLTFLMSLVVYAATMKFDIFYTITEEYAQTNYLYRLLFIAGVIFHIQFRYITAWSLGLVSFHMSGLSYDSKTQKFDKVQVTKMLEFYLNPSLKVKTQCWNMSVQVALKRYIYEVHYNPVGHYKNEKEKRKIQHSAQTYTVMTSAFWHGLYPGYFITFFHLKLYLKSIQQIYRWRIKNKKVNELYNKLHFHHIENILSNYAIMYFGIFFHVMTWERIVLILKATYFLPFVILYLAYFLIVEMRVLSNSKQAVETPLLMEKGNKLV